MEKVRTRMVKPADCWAGLRYVSDGQRYTLFTPPRYGPNSPLATQVRFVLLRSNIDDPAPQLKVLFAQLAYMLAAIVASVSLTPKLFTTRSLLSAAYMAQAAVSCRRLFWQRIDRLLLRARIGKDTAPSRKSMLASTTNSMSVNPRAFPSPEAARESNCTCRGFLIWDFINVLLGLFSSRPLDRSVGLKPARGPVPSLSFQN